MRPDSKTLFCRSTVGATVTLGVCGAFLLVGVTAVTAEAISSDGAVRALEDSIGLLKWIGGAIVTGLTAAVGLLYRALEKSNAQQRSDLIEGLKARETLISTTLENSVKLQGQVAELNENVKELVEFHQKR